MKNLKLALRSLLNFKLYSIINIIGLSLCLACVIVIFRYVYGEISMDRFNSKLDRLYATYIQIESDVQNQYFSGLSNRNNDKTFVDLREHPAIETSTTFVFLPENEVKVDNKLYTISTIAGDEEFMNVLDFPILAGNIDLSQPELAGITKEYATRLFGKEDPLGQKIRLDSGKEVTITGIIDKTSSRSTIQFDLLVSKNLTKHWSRMENTIILLYPNQDYKKINEEYGEFFPQSSYSGQNTRYQLFPYKDIYLNSNNIGTYCYTTGSKTNIILLFTVGVLILLIGIANFINIYLAVVMRRGREFGMKKVFGASGENIFSQLFLENFTLVGIAVILGLSITELFSPLIRNLLGFEQIPFISFDFTLAGIILLILPFITTLFPYLRYRYQMPITSLHSVGKTGGRGISRRIFLVFQYCLTLFMIILSIFFNKQLFSILNTDPGFRTQDIIHLPPFIKSQSDYGIYVSDEEWQAQKDKTENIKQEIIQRLNETPLFLKWTFGDSPVKTNTHDVPFRLEGEDFKKLTLNYACHQWMNIFDIQLVDGRLFDKEKDKWGEYTMIVTESALKHYNISNWREAKLQPERRLWWSYKLSAEESESNPPYQIIGVVKDIKGSYLGEEIYPNIFTYNEAGPERADFFGLIAPGKHQEAIIFLQKLQEETVGGEFIYSFLEDELKALYDEDKKVATVYTIFTIIAIIISMMGLFSMSLFDVQQRYNEIAIRKVNGATTYNIISMLLKKYISFLLLAFVISSPAAWFIITRYLENFAFKTPISWWIFALALVITTSISLLTLIFQTGKAAKTNPAVVIRNE